MAVSQVFRPAGQPITRTLVTVYATADQRTIIVSLPEYQDALRRLMRDQGYQWSDRERHWRRTLPATAGDWRDRLAEITHALVGAGFAVRLDDAEACVRAQSGAFQPEQRRWVSAVTTGEYAGWLALRWAPGDDLYGVALRLRGARWRQGRLVVPIGAADEVEEFAATYEFQFTPAARALITQARDELAHGVVLSAPKTHAKRRTPVDRVVPPVLPVPAIVEIADALRDDD